MSTHTLGTLKDRVRWARETAGLSARELSRFAGLTKSHINLFEVEESRTRLSGAALLGLSDVLGVSMEWLVDGRGKMPSARALVAAAKRARRRAADESASSSD